MAVRPQRDTFMLEARSQNNEEINKIMNIIINAIPVLEIYIFGSYANETAKEDSDFDFYVVIPGNSFRAREATWKIREGLVGKQKRGIDMLVGIRHQSSDAIPFETGNYLLFMPVMILTIGLHALLAVW